MRPLKPSFAANIFVYSLLHFCVDAASIMHIMGGLQSNSNLFQLILWYNALAFGLQLPLGILFDKLKNQRLASFSGILLLCCGILLNQWPALSVFFVGLGNALFHVGGGIAILNQSKGKATLPGIFVSTGTLGLFFGAFMIKQFDFEPFLMILLLLLLGSTLLLVKPLNQALITKQTHSNKIHYFKFIVVFLLLTITLRSTVGLSLNFTWKVNDFTGLLLALSIFLGKGLGGWLSDKIGWFKLAVSGLLLSAFCLYFLSNNLVVALIGVFLFNISMPVTLTAMSNIMPGKKGLAFGLTTMALLLGSMPTFFRTKEFFAQPNIILIAMLISVCSLALALHLYFRISQNRH